MNNPSLFSKKNNRSELLEKKGGSQKIFRFLISILLVILSIPVIVVLFYQYSISRPLSSSGDFRIVEIVLGENREQIAEKLVNSGVIRSKEMFVWYIKISKKGGLVQAGEHKIPLNSNIKEIVEILETVPETNTLWVTIPEGLRFDEIAEIIYGKFSGHPEENKVSKERLLQIFKNPHDAVLSAKAKSFLAEHLPSGKNIEGFVYPDTYNFECDASEEEVVSVLVETLAGKMTPERINKVDNSGYNMYEVLNIASMLEREAFTEKEATMIADIILRRLEIGMYLGIDATSLYPLKDWKAQLTYKELEDPNPYNTRKNIGLPPSPISNPGIMTIDAVLSPERNEYLFYLHGTDGRIHYAKTNSEHEMNKAKYL